MVDADRREQGKTRTRGLFGQRVGPDVQGKILRTLYGIEAYQYVIDGAKEEAIFEEVTD